MNKTKISSTSTMQEILTLYPGAREALFRRYHVGGDGQKEIELTQTLSEVCTQNNIQSVEHATDYLQNCYENEGKMEITTKELEAELKSNPNLRLLDVRTPDENKYANIAQGTLVNEKVAKEVLEWPRDTPIVLYCHHGGRSLDAAMNLISNQFTNVRSLAGGIDAWSIDIDSSIPRYTTSPH